MTNIMQESLSLNLRVMRFFGYFPTEKYFQLYNIFGYCLYIVLVLPIPILGFLYLLLEESVDFVRVCENSFLLGESACYIFKLYPFVANGRKIKNCILTLETATFKKYNENNKNILEECKLICQRNTNIFFTLVLLGVISWASRPLFWKERRPPVDLWLPFNNASTQSYHCVYAYLVVGVAYVAFSCGAIDPLIAGLAYQATGQIKILKHNLQHLSENEDVYLKLKICIQHHNAILKFAEDYENCFSYAVFSQFIGSIFVICVSCLELMLIDVLSFNFIAMIIYLMIMLTEIYLFCYYGTLLYKESNTITESIYMSKWYEYNIKTKKALIIIMERSTKPIIITAAKVMDLSLVTFTMILRRSYSLMAVLQNYR